jgi:hypothetical protein
MSPASPRTDLRWLPRTLRIAGIVVLLVVQGSCAFVAQTIYRLSTSVERPSREARQAATLAAGTAQSAVAFPSAMGYVDRFDADGSLTVMTAEAPARVRIDRLTIVRTPDGLASASDIYPGASVVVAGDVDGEGRILADVVLLRPPP